MDKLSGGDEAVDIRPTPDDFCNYLPWACNQLQMDCVLLITKVQQNEYVSAGLTDRSKKNKSRIKLTQSRHDVSSDQEKDEKSPSDLYDLAPDYKTVIISATYDNMDNLVEIKFVKNKLIPRLVLKVIGLIIKFQPYITKLTIDGGMDKYTVYEINKFLNNSFITEICFDNSFLSEANYVILLDNSNSLRHLSLARCRIEDCVAEIIAAKLTYPNPSSKSLSILNLSSNRITDFGAKYLAQALRTNRKLSYLSLAGNRLTDNGAGEIFDILMEFPLTCEEILATRSRHVLFLKEKNEMTNQKLYEIKAGDFDRKISKRKSIRPASAASGKKGKLDKESSQKSLGEGKSLVNVDFMYYDKAVAMVENILGEFNDPHNKYNTVVRDEIVYCKGNNALCIINLAYNNLTYLSLRKVLEVLIFQKLVDRKPRGLINLCLEGNNLPTTCKELTQIDDMLEMGLMAHNRRISGAKKRPQSKNTPR